MDAVETVRTIAYRFADLYLDLGRRRVLRGDVHIPLGKLSYEFLRVLAAASPDVVPHAELIARVWQERVVSPETLTQRVKLLRNALEDSASEPRYIGLSWGSGYHLIPPVERVTVASRPERRLAVLPFENLSREPSDLYFAAGMHDEILSRVAGLEGLEVAARTSVRQYERTRQSIPDIATELGVGAVVEGSIRYAGSRVRITAQLIDGQSGMHIWAKTYERELSDVFGVQSDVAKRIALALRASVARNHDFAAAWVKSDH